MPGVDSQLVRSGLTTLLVACWIAVGALVAAWSVEAAGLPAPEHADLVGARTTGWLMRYRYAESTIHIRHLPTLRGRCLQGWFPGPYGRERRGTLLSLSNGETLLAIPSHRVVVDGARRSQPSALSLIELQLAGCPRILGRRLARVVQSDLRLHALRAFVDGGPAVALRMSRSHPRLTLYVRPLTDEIVGVSATGRRYSGRSAVRLTRLTPGVLHALEAHR